MSVRFSGLLRRKPKISDASVSCTLPQAAAAAVRAGLAPLPNGHAMRVQQNPIEYGNFVHDAATSSNAWSHPPYPATYMRTPDERPREALPVHPINNTTSHPPYPHQSSVRGAGQHSRGRPLLVHPVSSAVGQSPYAACLGRSDQQRRMFAGYADGPL